MMLALGCVQSLTCNSNRCPSGVATQDPRLMNGLVVADKSQRVAQYHAATAHATLDLITSADLRHTLALSRTHVYRRINQREIKRYDEIFPYLPEHSLLGCEIPDAFKLIMDESGAESFAPSAYLTRIGSDCRAVKSTDDANKGNPVEVEEVAK